LRPRRRQFGYTKPNGVGVRLSVSRAAALQQVTRKQLADLLHRELPGLTPRQVADGVVGEQSGVGTEDHAVVLRDRLELASAAVDRRRGQLKPPKGRWREKVPTTFSGRLFFGRL
jgi:hypothetical protein